MRFLKYYIFNLALVISSQLFSATDMPSHVYNTVAHFRDAHADIKNMSKFKYYYLKFKDLSKDKCPLLTVEEYSAVTFFYNAVEFEQDWNKFFRYCYATDIAFCTECHGTYAKSRKILDVIFNPEYQNCSKDLFIYVLYEALYDEKPTKINQKKRSELINECLQILDKAACEIGLSNPGSMKKWFQYYINYVIKKKITIHSWTGGAKSRWGGSTYYYYVDSAKTRR
ncbi:MAG: hypothetical protein WC707_03950 [Candidatus Babeliaceae bacterium]|jgi:hypothetical protein